MLGKNQLSFGAGELMSGMAASDYGTDGALGVLSSSINPFLKQGVIRATAAPVTQTTNLVDKMIATCEYPTSAYALTGVDAVGKFYGISTAGALTVIGTGSATTKYVFGTTDAISFNGKSYVSLTDDIAQIDPSGPTLTESWWVGTKSQSSLGAFPHPMIVFNGLMWVANGNVLNSITTGGTIVTSALILEATDIIYALHIDPGTGFMMVSAVKVKAGQASTSTVSIFDGVTTLPRRVTPTIDDVITGFRTVAGTVYVGCANRLGVWNGSGVVYLRTLKNAAPGTSGDLLWKHHMTSYGNILLYADGKDVIAYGEPTGLSKKGFFPITGNQIDSSHLSAICLLASGVIGFGWITSSTPKWFTTDITSTSAGTGVVYFTNVFFPRPVFIRSVRVVTDGITTTAGIGGVALITEKQATVSPAVSTFVVLSAVSPRYVFDFNYTSLEVVSIQPKFTLDTQGFSVTRALIYYDVAE